MPGTNAESEHLKTPFNTAWQATCRGTCCRGATHFIGMVGSQSNSHEEWGGVGLGPPHQETYPITGTGPPQNERTYDTSETQC
eukprot:12919200-Prorocentrum_lima.AAC.1